MRQNCCSQSRRSSEARSDYVTLIMANVSSMVSSETELLINLWQNEPSLWDTSQTCYSDADVRKAVIARISKNMNGLIGIDLLTACKCTILFTPHYQIQITVWK